MPKKRTSMTNIKEVLRLKYECGLSIRQIASCTKVSRSTISEIINRFAQGSLQWPLQPQQSESFLNQQLFHDKSPASRPILPKKKRIKTRCPPCSKRKKINHGSEKQSCFGHWLYQRDWIGDCPCASW
jgi:transposase-like protein